MKKIIEPIAGRWSPRRFLAGNITPGDIEELITAAGRAPSSMNEQPWYFYYAIRGEKGFDSMLECLYEGNQEWAAGAGALILAVAKKRFRYKDRPNRHALYDTGAASVLLAVQASASGLQAHQMGGFDISKTSELFKLDSETEEPAAFIAIGIPDPSDAGYDMKNNSPASVRKELDAISKHWQE